MKDTRASNLWKPDAPPNERLAVWALVVPPVVVFVLVLILMAGAAPAADRTAALIIVACATSVAVAAAVSVRVVRHMRAVERQRDAFYQEFARLSKLASLGEASCSIAHDLNNPLAIMNEEVGWLQDLLNGTDTDEEVTRREFASSVEQVQIQIGRCREIARRMLTWTRDPEEPSGQVEINRLLTKTLYLVETELVATGVHVVKHLDPELPAVTGGSAELRQVLLNLMKNALDAMKGVGGTLAITTARIGDTVRITIADSGPGIRSELMDRIFEPFFTTKGEEHGNGLGLTISLWITQRLGGRIDVESTPGSGSAFHVTLPLAGSGTRPMHSEGAA